MKNNFGKFFVALFAAIYVILNILIFTIVDFNRLNCPQFWISWGFMFGINIPVLVILFFKLRKNNQNDIRILPVGLVVGGNVVYLVLGILFTLIMPKTVVVAVTDVIVAIVYALLVYRFILMVSYIRDNDAHRRKKVAYIRQLTTMVESYASLAVDDDTSDCIKKLAADFRYSDPMSHESLAGDEERLMEMAVALEDVVRDGDAEAVKKATDDIKRVLKLRNAKCANLK